MTARTLKKATPVRTPLKPKLAEAMKRWGSGVTAMPTIGDRTPREFLFVMSFAAVSLEVVSAAEIKLVWGLILGTARDATPDQVDMFVNMIDDTAVKRGFSGRVGAESLSCPCGHTGEPTLAWTWLGDLVLRIGAWCRWCRERGRFVRPTHEVVATVMPWTWLPHDKKLPDPGAPWPTVRSVNDSRLDMPFGANEGSAPFERTIELLSTRDPKRYGEDTLYDVRKPTPEPTGDDA